MSYLAQNYPLAQWRATVLVTIIFRVSSRSADGRDAHRGKSRRRAWLTRYKESFICLFVSELIDIFRALADPTRLRVVALLREMELAIGELAIVLDQSQPRVSRHVRILVEAGVVERRREGGGVFVCHAPRGPAGEIIGQAE